MAYRVYDPVSRRVLVSRDIVFDETHSWDWSKSADHIASLAEELIFDYELILVHQTLEAINHSRMMLTTILKCRFSRCSEVNNTHICLMKSSQV